jgi:hypothetical protein
MAMTPLELLKRELEMMQTRMDELRVQANLGKRELRDAVDGLRSKFDSTYDQAKKTLGEAAATGARESQTVAKSLLAGWEEVRRTYKKLSEESLK